jgi:hypothetical protein
LKKSKINPIHLTVCKNCGHKKAHRNYHRAVKYGEAHRDCRICGNPEVAVITLEEILRDWKEEIK